MKKVIYLIIAIALFNTSCNSTEEEIYSKCTYDSLTGEYVFFTETDTSSHKIEFIGGIDSFTTNGINGYGFWFPASPLSGILNECEININEYNDVKRKGLSSPGGIERWYYESMNGYGEFFPENDSIVLFINYKRTGDFTENFSGDIYFKKVN